MIKFNKPLNLNGTELLQELTNVGVSINNNPVIDENNDFWLDISELDKQKAIPVVAAHNGTTVVNELTVVEKLASVGLSIDDLKVALEL